MPPVVKALPPASLKRLLEAAGYRLIEADDDNMAFARGIDDEPIIVPGNVDHVAGEICMHVARKVGFQNYFEELYATFPDIFPPELYGPKA
jgi:hypothetical protein